MRTALRCFASWHLFPDQVPLFVDIHNDIAENPMVMERRPELTAVLAAKKAGGMWKRRSDRHSNQPAAQGVEDGGPRHVNSTTSNDDEE